MLPHKCVLPLLTAYLMLEEVSTSVLPHRLRKDVSLMEQALLQNSDDLSVGDVGDAGNEPHGRVPHSLALRDPAGRTQQNQHQPLQKTNEHRRRKVAPLDSLSSFWKSSVRNRKDEHVTY